MALERVCVFDELVVIRGAGDLGSGVALRLWRSGFDVVLLERDRPMAVRRTVAFSEAAFEGAAVVEGVTAVLAESVDDVPRIVGAGRIPLLIDPEAVSVSALRPRAVVDAVLAKRNLGTRKEWAPMVIGLGPGFRAGDDVHAVVETNRGPNLGRVLWRGGAEANTGQPAPVGGHAADRVLRAPATGVISDGCTIGAVVDRGNAVCAVAGVPVPAAFTGLVRGLLRDGAVVSRGTKIGDLDPRMDRSLVERVSDKSLAVAGGVLEAVMMGLHGRVVR